MLCIAERAGAEPQPDLLGEAQRLCGWAPQTVRLCLRGLHGLGALPGKRVRRELYRSEDIREWPGWESARQVWRIKQTVKDDEANIIDMTKST